MQLFSSYRTWKGPKGETLDGTNNACEHAIAWWVKERYRTMRGYKVPESGERQSPLAWCGNFLTTEDASRPSNLRRDS